MADSAEEILHISVVVGETRRYTFVLEKAQEVVGVAFAPLCSSDHPLERHSRPRLANSRTCEAGLPGAP